MFSDAGYFLQERCFKSMSSLAADSSDCVFTDSTDNIYVQEVARPLLDSGYDSIAKSNRPGAAGDLELDINNLT